MNDSAEELMYCLIMRAVKIIYDFWPRDTQMIAVMLALQNLSH